VKHALPTYQIALILVIILGLHSCEIINPEETFPSFLRIESFDLEADYLTHGTESQKITEAWVFADGQELGSFELPADIPILQSGNTNIQVRAGIKVNGISETRDIYPFYTGYNEIVNLSAGTTSLISPTVTYQDQAMLLTHLDFETTIGIDNENETNLISTVSDEAEVFEGSKSLIVNTTASNPNFQISLSETQFINVPSLINAYLEMDYRNSELYTVFIRAFFGGEVVSIDLVNISPQEDWNKIYIELGTPIRELNADAYEIGFRATEISGGATEASFLWDNIKFIVSTL